MQLKVVLIKEQSQRSELLRQSLLDSGHEITGELSNLARLLEYAGTSTPDLVIIFSNSPDEAMLAQLRELAVRKPLPVILCTKEHSRNSINKAVRAGVSAYIVGDPDQYRIDVIIDVALARFRDMARLRQELQDAKTRLSERKVVERAKGILMKQRGFDEPQAFHALRKIAMDKNLRIGQVAENIIAVSELLN